MLITDTTDFSSALMFGCGQCFRFAQTGDGVYSGAAYGKVLTLTDTPDGVLLDCSQEDFDKLWSGYFDLNLDYAAIREKVSVNAFMSEAAEFGRGIRILRQDFWEALCSFIISQCNNIPRIRVIIERLCQKYGEPIQNGYNAFPPAHKVAALSAQDLRALGTGYRAEYILNAARAAADGVLSGEVLYDMPFEDAKKTLMGIHGVGSKVADCVLLYGLHKLGAFPVDVWMKRALDTYFPKDFDYCVFGEYAGIAQQYIFHYTRFMSRVKG